MSLLDGVRHQLRALFGARRYARELDAEMQFHLSLDAMQREHAAHGALSAGDARLAARRRFGNLTSITESTRAVAGLSVLDAVVQDARFAAHPPSPPSRCSRSRSASERTPRSSARWTHC